MSILNKFIILVTLLTACKQSPPPDIKVPDEKGDLFFSGYYWNYKDRPTPVGPGPNRFLGTDKGAWVDSLGRLHLKIQKINNLWYCSEIISVKEFGYGTYIFTCESDISAFDERTVFGLFTWDDYSFQKQANSEVDIEFSKWGVAGDSLTITYSVQPVIFSNAVPYKERTYKPLIASKYVKKPATYMFKWTPDLVSWEGYEGEVYPGTNKTSEWQFDKSNISRQKIEGSNTSDPIVIPAPGDSTNVRFNFWLLNGQGPANGKDHEIVVKNFRFIPL